MLLKMAGRAWAGDTQPGLIAPNRSRPVPSQLIKMVSVLALGSSLPRHPLTPSLPPQSRRPSICTAKIIRVVQAEAPRARSIAYQRQTGPSPRCLIPFPTAPVLEQAPSPYQTPHCPSPSNSTRIPAPSTTADQGVHPGVTLSIG